MYREADFNILLRSNKLSHQFWVDQYAKIEQQRLNFLRFNQTQLRAEKYSKLRDAVESDGNVRDIGQLIILPSTFVGSPRYMHERYQDAMTYVKNFGKPDLFITMTCNPNWPEITRELLPNQTPQDRHDLIARVFRLQVKQLIRLLTKKRIFGRSRAHAYSIEWQKRGLPHVHLLHWLYEKLDEDSLSPYALGGVGGLVEENDV